MGDAWVIYQPDPQRHTGEAADVLLDALALLARGLFPAWLGAEVAPFAGRAVTAVAARALGRAAAQARAGFGPFWEAAAERAISDLPLRGGFAREVEAEQLSLMICTAYRVRQLVLLVELPPVSSGDDSLQGVLEWFAVLSQTAVVVCGCEARAAFSRYPRWEVRLEVVAPAESEQPPIVAAPVTGLPHPLSAVERALARRLDAVPWGATRVHNALLRLGAFSRDVRIDVLWPTERVAVEVDGPEHLRQPRFSDDRLRDMELQLLGYLVVRVTNDEVQRDPDSVMARIERCVRAARGRRGGE
jgi:very-short-patch-repair endonuclease